VSTSADPMSLLVADVCAGDGGEETREGSGAGAKQAHEETPASTARQV